MNIGPLHGQSAERSCGHDDESDIILSGGQRSNTTYMVCEDVEEVPMMSQGIDLLHVASPCVELVACPEKAKLGSDG